MVQTPNTLYTNPMRVMLKQLFTSVSVKGGGYLPRRDHQSPPLRWINVKYKRYAMCTAWATHVVLFLSRKIVYALTFNKDTSPQQKSYCMWVQRDPRTPVLFSRKNHRFANYLWCFYIVKDWTYMNDFRCCKKKSLQLFPHLFQTPYNIMDKRYEFV